MCSALEFRAILDPKDSMRFGDLGIEITNQLTQQVALRVLEKTTEWLRLQCVVFLADKGCATKTENVPIGQKCAITFITSEKAAPQIVFAITA